MTSDNYELGKVGSGFENKKYDKMSDAVNEFGDRLSGITGKYQLKAGPSDKFGMKRSLKNTKLRVTSMLDSIPYGHRITARGSVDSEDHFMIHRTLGSLGSQVVDAAISQLGVPYIWADIDPAGGGSAGFDCSGIIVWCYSQVGVTLPHMAEAIRTDPIVTLFQDKTKVQPGDMVFYHTGSQGKPSYQADHIALMVDHDNTIVAPGTGGFVEHQPTLTSYILSYGYVKRVTGAH